MDIATTKEAVYQFAMVKPSPGESMEPLECNLAVTSPSIQIAG